MTQQPDTLAGVKRPFSLPTASAAPHPRPSGRGAFPRGEKKPVEWRGLVYPSQKALARTLGVSEQRVSEAIKLGRLQYLGKGPKKRTPTDAAKREASRVKG